MINMYEWSLPNRDFTSTFALLLLKHLRDVGSEALFLEYKPEEGPLLLETANRTIPEAACIVHLTRAIIVAGYPLAQYVQP